MPAELFPVELVGAGLLIWSASRAKYSVRIMVFGVLSAFIFLAGGQLFALITDATSGAMTSWQLLTITTTIILYTLSIIIIGIEGIRFTRIFTVKKKG